MIMSFGKQLVRKLTKPVYIIQYLKKDEIVVIVEVVVVVVVVV